MSTVPRINAKNACSNRRYTVSVSGYGEDHDAHLEWEKLHAAATRAISDYEIYELGLAAEKGRRKMQLVNEGAPVWRAEAQMAVEAADEGAELGKAVLALRTAREFKENAMLLRDAARNRAWKR